MKRSAIKLSVFFATFVVALLVISRIMNQGHDNLTMEMPPATLPLVSMEMDGYVYNQLHGYTQTMEIPFMRDTVTVLGEGRDTGFVVDTFGRNVTGISIEVRSTDGGRLIENTQITGYRQGGDRISGEVALKDLIEKDKPYSLALILELNGSQKVYYYTRVVWGDNLHGAEKLAYVKDFHDRLYDKEAARELAIYLETDARLEDNSSFHRVNIHSSFQQITWGKLPVQEVAEPVVRLTEIADQTASLLVDYMVSTSEGKQTTYYMVQEHYRVRYTAERMYLLDYERTMTQVPQAEEMYANDKILLGITGTDIPMMESEDGNVVVFEVAGRLFGYNVNNNKLTVIFSFYDEENADARTLYGQHAIKILDVDEGGNVQFALYGYMNRGKYEGQVGIRLYTYNHSMNTLEELVYIPYRKSFSVLAAQMDQLLCLNRDQKLYLELDDAVYRIDLVERTWSRLFGVTQDDSLHVSENHKIAVWSEGEDPYRNRTLNIRNLNNDVQKTILVEEGECIRPLGFMEEDIIYGVAREADIYQENSGRIFFPMYKIGICNSAGELLKEYQEEGIYVTACAVEHNQITLTRMARLESDTYVKTSPDHIMNNRESESGKNVLVTADIDIYERYVQIQTRKTIDSKSIKILNPKEVVYEGGRELELPGQKTLVRYYVYGPYGVAGIFTSPAGAVNMAYALPGVVIDGKGDLVWLRGNRSTRNQIMAIKAPERAEGQDSLAVCLDTIFQLEGLVRNSAYLLDQGESVLDILEDNLPDARILDLTGCSLDAMLYYVNQDLPVLAMLRNGEAVLVTGFNETSVVVMEPSTGKLEKRGMADTGEWLEDNGNCFITYIR